MKLPKTGEEYFQYEDQSLQYNLLSFWKWSGSDLVSNVTRGRLAEYIVAIALGISVDGVRNEWSAYDLETDDDIKIEVKSAAYIQSWFQKENSAITFRVPKTRAWDPFTNLQGREIKRQADVYVFALLAHKEKETINPLDLSQWEFFVLPTRKLDEREKSQHSITLKSLQKECNCANGVRFDQLCDQVKLAAIEQLQR